MFDAKPSDDRPQCAVLEVPHTQTEMCVSQSGWQAAMCRVRSATYTDRNVRQSVRGDMG